MRLHIIVGSLFSYFGAHSLELANANVRASMFRYGEVHIMREKGFEIRERERERERKKRHRPFHVSFFRI